MKVSSKTSQEKYITTQNVSLKEETFLTLTSLLYLLYLSFHPDLLLSDMKEFRDSSWDMKASVVMVSM